MYDSPISNCSVVTDCMESSDIILTSFRPLVSMTVSARRVSEPSIVSTAVVSSSESLPERKSIVSKAASVSAEQPAKAA